MVNEGNFTEDNRLPGLHRRRHKQLSRLDADEENDDINCYPSFKTLTYIYANLVITFEIELLFEGNKSIITSFLICFINIIRHPYRPFRVCVKIKFFRSKLYIRVLMLYLV